MSNLISFLRHLKVTFYVEKYTEIQSFKVHKLEKQCDVWKYIFHGLFFSIFFIFNITTQFLVIILCFLLLVFCIEASSHSLAIALHAYNLNVIKNIAACVRDNVFVHVFLCGWNCVYYCTSKIINYFKNALNLHFYLNINLI